jgi:hypothetical protein
MAATSPHVGGMPRDVHARERLRAAQQREAQAVAAVYVAERSLGKACAKRDEVLAAATAVVDKARQSVASAQTALVGVSGFDRAAALLGIEVADLRRSVGNTRRSGGD